MSKKMSKRALGILLAALMLLSVLPVSLAVQTDTVILYTNDVHCAIDDYAVLAAYRAELISQGHKVITVDAGDAIQGEVIGTLTQGEAIVDIMNAVGYDYAVPGNHEYDYGMETFLDIAETRANYEYISSNFYYLPGVRGVFEPYAIKDMGDYQIAFVGITTPESVSKANPDYFKDENNNFIYGFPTRDMQEGVLYENVQESVDSAIAEGADIVVAVGHLGILETTDGWKSTDVIANTNGIDFFIDAHSHETIESAEYKNKDNESVTLSSTGTKFANFGQLTIKADGASELKLINPDEVDVKNISADAKTAYDTVKAKIDGYNEEIAHLYEVIGTSEAELIAYDGDGSWAVRKRETNTGDFVADAYRAVTGADIALCNGGGIRNEIAVGDVTRKMLMDMNPWSNSMCVVEITGQQLLDVLEHGARSCPAPLGGFFQVSGLTYEINTWIESPVITDMNGNFESIDETKERRVSNVLVGGEPVDLKKIYTVAGTQYVLTSGGDGLTMLEGAKVIQQEGLLCDSEMLIKYFTENLGGKITAEKYGNPDGDGRIKIIDAEPKTKSYKAGDIIEFGEYPQSAVEDEALLAELNAQPLEWISYGYYSGDGSYGSAEASDYMKYADVELDGEKYRAVTFSEYRPWQSEHDFENSRYIQSDNGYETGTVYWFRFEPIKWKVLNPETGLVICESIIDSQPFQNKVYQNKNEFFLTAHYADPEFTIPANTYSSSSLKVWLEGDFSETAFNSSETEFISQQAHLISVAESTDADYGFDSDKQAQDTQRMRTGTDYSRIQGLQISETDPGSGNSYWWLGDSVTIYQLESAVCYSGSSNRAIGVTCTYIGVCPAININLAEVEHSIVLNKYDGSTETIPYKYGESISEIPDPEREGYTFTGWDAEIPETMPAKNLEFNAAWEVNSYDAVWNVDGIKTTEAYEFGASIATPADPVKEGYTFTGWDAEIPETMPAKNLEFNATWEVNSYDAVWNVDGTKTAEAYEFGAAIATPADPVKEGYTFTGWDAEIPETMPAKNLEFKAQWKVNKYKLTFKDYDESVISSTDAEYGSEITAPTPSREGYEFIGWTPALPGSMPAEDAEFVANYRKINVKSIEIIELPEKTEYFYKSTEEISSEGISVKVTYDNGTTEIITDCTQLTFEGFSTDEMGEVEITVAYAGLTDSFNVNVEFDLCTWLEYLLRVFVEFMNTIFDFFIRIFC